MNVTVRPVDAADFFAWIELYAAYGEFYKTPLDDEKALLVWSWITDPGHETGALFAVDDSGTPMGLAHYRAFARPLSGSRGLYLDDLFVTPPARSQGVASALLETLRSKAQAEGFSVVRWITAADNAVAQRLYDRLATKTDWVTYDLLP